MVEPESAVCKIADTLGEKIDSFPPRGKELTELFSYEYKKIEPAIYIGKMNFEKFSVKSSLTILEENPTPPNDVQFL